MLNKRNYIIFLLSILFSAFTMSSCKMVFYGLGQAKGQAKILIKAKPIKRILRKGDTNPDLKRKLLLVQEIRQFAIDSLGINDSKNYNTFYDQKGQYILWVVVASNPYDLIPYKWKFPIIGSLEYKGYFKKDKAIKEENRLKEQDFDTRIGTVSAWSTLGYFKDPILSKMLDQSDGQIAELIIHELTHATIFVKGNAQLNENMASFIGEEGAKIFLIHKYGIDSEEYKSYLAELKDYVKFANHILRGSLQLDSLYATLKSEPDSLVKDEKKYELILEIMTSIDTNHFETPINYKRLQDKNNLPNNAFFISYKTYRDQLVEMRQEFEQKFNSDLKKFLEYNKTIYSSMRGKH